MVIKQWLEGIGLIVNLNFLQCPFLSVSPGKQKGSGTLISELYVRWGQLGGPTPLDPTHIPALVGYT